MKTFITVPNILSLLRLIGSLGLIFIEPFSFLFFAVYSLCGISDAIDGYIARLLDQCTDVGARLDSVCDLTFYGVLLYKILPVLKREIPHWIFVFAGAAIMIRIGAYVTAALKFGCFASMHTYLNKLCGFTIFMTPYAMGKTITVGYCVIVCIAATAAALEELLIHLVNKDYDPDKKSIFLKPRHRQMVPEKGKLGKTA